MIFTGKIPIKREKKPALAGPIKRVKSMGGIDFDSPAKRREKVEVVANPVYIDKDYEEHKMGNSKIFVEIVDMLMMDYFDDKFKKKIKGLPRAQKRMMILALLDKERNLFLRAKAFIEDNIPKLKHIQDLILILREYVHVGEVEKKTLGEVMTPLELVKEMLNTLPKEVWVNPNLKWLDSCNGTGPFLAMVVYRLMVGLKDWEPDENKRYKHIVENMIFAGELQPKNQFLWITLMDPYDEFNLNVYTGSFLDGGFDRHMKEVWGIEKFDIIVGNPPYQTGKEGNRKTQPLWHLFVEKSISSLKENGYLCMVHPGGWRNVDGVFKATQNILKNKEIHSLKLHSFGQGQEVFNAAINFDYYCLKNTPNSGLLTKITCVDGSVEKLDISKLEFISDEHIAEIQKLVAKEGEEKVEVLYSRTLYGNDKKWMSKTETEEHIYPCVYTVKSPDKGNELGIWYSNLNKGYFNVPKVIMASGASGVHIDKSGTYGIMNFGFGIADLPSNLSKIQKALLSEKFIREVMGFKKSLGDKYNKKIISMFRKDFWKEFI